MNKIIIWVLAIFLLGSCTKDEKETPTPPAPQFKLDTETLILDIGQTAQVTTQGTEATAITPSVAWVEFAINKNVISVKAVNAGEQVFTIHSGKQTATLRIVVKTPSQVLQNGLGVYQAEKNLITANRIAKQPDLVWLSEGKNPYEKYIVLYAITPDKKVGDTTDLPIKTKGIEPLSGKEKLSGVIEIIKNKTAQIKTSEGLKVVVPIK